MLLDIFQESDFVCVMKSDENKKPYGLQFLRPGDLKLTEFQYYSANPLDPTTNRNDRGERTPRASINVSAFRNFPFEMDLLDLATQEKLVQHLSNKFPIVMATNSGGKSIHLMISVADILPFKPHTTEGIAQYSQAWRAISAELTLIASNFLGPACPARLFDPSCKDPARLTRMPMAVRPDTGLMQTPVQISKSYISSDEVLRLMGKHGFYGEIIGPKIEQCSEMDLELFSLRLLYPENKGLRSKLNQVEKWAAPENMYPVLFQLTLWIIDRVGAPLNITLGYMHDHIFPSLRAAGYPRNPEIAIYNAYIWKGLL